jgi:hypothetical protein
MASTTTPSTERRSVTTSHAWLGGGLVEELTVAELMEQLADYGETAALIIDELESDGSCVQEFDEPGCCCYEVTDLMAFHEQLAAYRAAGRPA